MGFNSAFKGLTASGFTLERGGSSIVGRGPCTIGINIYCSQGYHGAVTCKQPVITIS